MKPKTMRKLEIWTLAFLTISANTSASEPTKEKTNQTKEYNKKIVSEVSTRKIYSTTLSEPGSDALKIYFSNIVLPLGSYVEVSTPELKNSNFFIRKDALQNGVFIEGDRALIRLFVPKTGSFTSLNLKKVEITRTTQDSIQPRSLIGSDERKPLPCYLGTDIYSNSLAAGYIDNQGSGSIVGNGKYFLSNAHVIRHSDANGDKTLSKTGENFDDFQVRLGYYSDKCTNGTPPKEVTRVRLDKLEAYGDPGRFNDYALVKINEFDAKNSGIKEVFGSLKINDQGDNFVGQEIYVPQFGTGSGYTTMLVGEKSDGANAIITKTDGREVSYNADTLGGSSGAPLISRSLNQIVALHWGGGSNNAAVRNKVLQEGVLPTITRENNNSSTVGQGLINSKEIIFYPFNTEPQELKIPPNIKVEPFKDLEISHTGSYSKLELATQDLVTKKNGKKEVRLFFKRDGLPHDLSKASPQTEETLYIYSPTSESDRDEFSAQKIWLPLKLILPNGELAQNLIINATSYKYDPYEFPFDLNSPSTTQFNFEIPDRNKQYNLSKKFDGNQFSYISSYGGEGPISQDINLQPNTYSKIKVPLRTASGDEVTVNLRGTRITDCSSRPMNASVGCSSGNNSTLKISYDPSDNKNIPNGYYTGILPISAKSIGNPSPPPPEIDIAISVRLENN